MELRDNGAIAMGNFLRILAPQPVSNTMTKDTPLLETQFPTIVMIHPKMYRSVQINTQIQGNNAMGFVQNGAFVTINRTSPEETAYSGLFCHKQQIFD